MHRRDFLVRTAIAGTVASLPALPAASEQTVPGRASLDPLGDGRVVRRAWVERLVRLSEPVLSHLAAGTLKRSMPVEGPEDRRTVTHLEALGRTLAGAAPWLALPSNDDEEGLVRQRLLRLAQRAIAQAVDPSSPDALNFTTGSQPLVDAAFLAQAVVRAPRPLWEDLEAVSRQRLVDALQSTRAITPFFNNWLLFSAMVEAALMRAGARWDATRVDYALRQHEQWYRGDGTYADGPVFHWDYYNSFVIHPMLVDVLEVCGPAREAWGALRESVSRRALRYAAVLERMIAPDGTFPPIGRSLAYRCGAFHALAQAALQDRLPDEVPAAQARSALTAVISRTLDAPGTYDAAGWLRIGLVGHQPGLGERYISTGSLYLCSTAFLPLGLPASQPFWTGPGQPWTARRAWAGEAIPIDSALKDGG